MKNKDLNRLQFDSVFSYTFSIIVEANRRVYKLEEKANYLTASRIIALKSRTAGVEPATDFNGITLINKAASGLIHVNFKKSNTEVIEKLPFAYIVEATQQRPDLGYPVMISNIDFSQSEIRLDPQAVGIGEAIEITVIFDKELLKN